MVDGLRIKIKNRYVYGVLQRTISPRSVLTVGIFRTDNPCLPVNMHTQTT